VEWWDIRHASHLNQGVIAMNIQRPSCAVVGALIATQVLGPAVLWAADQRGIQIEANRRVMVASLSGDQLTVQNGESTQALHFRDAVNVGDHITTGDRTVVDVLIGNRAVMTLGQDTSAQFTMVSDEQTTVQLSQGLVRVAAAASALGTQGLVTVQTPTGQVQTRGGIIRVLVDQPVGSAEHTPIGESKPYLASYSTGTAIAAITPRSAIFQVEEGSAEILAGAEGKAVTLQAGQTVTLQSGQAGPISGFVNQAGVRAGVLATAEHSQTSKEGRDHLVALQVEQATALGNALTGAAETGNKQSGDKEDNKNVINGATGGVTLASNNLVSALFGGGRAADTPSNIPQDRTGVGQGGANNNGFGVVSATGVSVKVNGETPLLVFTRKDPVAPYLDNVRKVDNIGNLEDHDFARLTFRPEPAVVSRFTVAKELVLIGGSGNIGHGGIAPADTLIIRGASKPSTSGATTFTNLASTVPSTGGDEGFDGLFPSDRDPVFVITFGQVLPDKIAAANSTFVVTNTSTRKNDGSAFVGGSLGQYSSLPTPCPNCIAIDSSMSHVDGAITATSSQPVPIVNLAGGVTLDQGTKATIGTTSATNNYYTADAARKSTLQDLGATFTGSLLSVIDGPTADNPTAVTVQGRLLGVYDGSIIDTKGGNKALLSVLDAKLTSPSSSIPLIDIAAGSHFTRNYVKDGTGDIVLTPDGKGNKNLTFKDDTTPGSTPDVKVTSAVVVRSTIPLLDGALLEASAPLFALTQAHMTTTSHFADLAGGNKNQPSLVLGDALVALSASTLTIQNGHLLNLNAATATVNGYLFSLTNGSTLTLNHGALFNATNGSALNLNGNAFGVFGSGANTLSINNNLCTATCFQLVNSANQPVLLNGTPLHVAGATHNVVLPNNFNVFALAPGAPAPTINIGANDALFTVDGTSTLTIKGIKVQ
jgi:hypothetical protein